MFFEIEASGLQRGMDQGLMRSVQCTALAHKNFHVIRLLANGPALIVNVKGETLVLEKTAERRGELRFTPKKYEMLKWSSNSVLLVYNVPFQRLMKPAKQSGKDIFEKAQAEIYIAPHNSHRIVALSNTEQYFLSHQKETGLCVFYQ